MKTSNLLKGLLALPVMIMGFSAPAFAHKVVHVQGTLYVIICEPGGNAFTFNGTASGAGEIGSYLCPSAAIDTGGGASGGGFEFLEAKPAPAVSSPRGSAMGKPATGGTSATNCPKGTHWYEPAKACVANGGHPSL